MKTTLTFSKLKKTEHDMIASRKGGAGVILHYSGFRRNGKPVYVSIPSN